MDRTEVKHVGYIFVGLKWIMVLVLIAAMIAFTAANALPVIFVAVLFAIAWALGLMIDTDKREAAALREFPYGLPPPPPPEDE